MLPCSLLVLIAAPNPTHADYIELTSTEQSNRMNRGF